MTQPATATRRRSTRRAGRALTLALGLGAVARSAAGAGEADEPAGRVAPPAKPALELEWASDDPSCQGSEPVTREVARLLGERTPDLRLRARAEVRKSAGRWTVRLETSSATHAGQRSLEGESCAEVRRAIALLLAMTLEAEAARVVEPPAAPATPAPSPPAGPTPPREPIGGAPVPPPSARAGVDAGPEPPPSELSFHAQAHAAAASGLLPSTAIGVGASVGVELGSWSLLAGVTHWPEQRLSIPDGPGAVLLSGQTLDLSVCWTAARTGALSAAPCLVPKLTWIHGSGTGIADELSGTRRLPGLGADVEMRIAPGGSLWYVTLRPGISWDRAQPFHLVTPPGCVPGDPDCVEVEIHSTAPMSPRLRAGVGMRL